MKLKTWDRILWCAIGVTVIAFTYAVLAEEQETWRGLRVEPENRCSPYDARKYKYPANLDRKHIEAQGISVDRKGKLEHPFPSPYISGISFRYLQDMDIEHIVPRSEAHDSGLCAFGPARWRTFASDRLNITVASEHVNRTLKSDKEPHEWLPDISVGWYVNRWIDVKRKYDLSVDPKERDALRELTATSTPLRME